MFRVYFAIVRVDKTWNWPSSGILVSYSRRGIESSTREQFDNISWRGSINLCHVSKRFHVSATLTYTPTRKPLYGPSNFQQGASDWKGRIERNENYWQRSTAAATRRAC